MASPATKSRRRVLDEDSFQQMLAAAFVVQEHNVSKTQENSSAASVVSTVHDTNPNDNPTDVSPAFAYVMEQIVATQHQIQTRRLELQQAMDLIVARVLPIVHAQGAAIALVDNGGQRIIYRAAVGHSSGMAGQKVRTAAALCAESVRNGATVQCADAATDFRIDSKVCEQRGARGLITIPVYRAENIAGALELVFTKPGSFADHDVRTCQLMAGMVTEALDRSAEIEFKQSLVSERATMLEALAKLKPQLERMVESGPASSDALVEVSGQASACASCGGTVLGRELRCPQCGAARAAGAGNDVQSRLAAMIRKNGTNLSASKPDAHRVEQISDPGPDEPRLDTGLLKAPPRTNNIPGPHEFANTDVDVNEEFSIPPSVIDELEASLREYDPDRVPGEPDSLDIAHKQPLPDYILPVAIKEDEKETKRIHATDLQMTVLQEKEQKEEHAAIEEHSAETNSAQESATEDQLPIESLRITPEVLDENAWTSASKAKAWLESIADPRTRTAMARFLQRRRAEIYLGAAVLVVGFAVWWTVWGGGPTWKDLGGPTTPSASASTDSPATLSPRRRVKPPEPELTTYEKFMVAIGLAEAPPAPAYLGNPDVNVWVDLQTGLYYCPNADLYNATPKGKFTSQRDAQLDQFEPAYRKACD
jgi:GAF domain-containing protein